MKRAGLAAGLGAALLVATSCAPDDDLNAVAFYGHDRDLTDLSYRHQRAFVNVIGTM